MSITLAVVTNIIAMSTLAKADTSAGRIVVCGDEWAFSDAGITTSSTYVANVVKWFGLAPAGSGKKVLILDGQSWNAGFNNTYGAFGTTFRSMLAENGASVTYRGYTDDPVALSGYDAIFVDGLNTKYTSLTADLASFVGGGGAVYVAGGTGTFSGGDIGEAAYWQPFFTTSTGASDFGLGDNGWFARQGTLHASGPVGDGVTLIDWYMGQNVRVGSSPNANAAVWDSSGTLVATWSADTAGLSLKIKTQPQSQVSYWGKSVSFSVNTSNGIPPLTYQWLKDGVAIPDATNSLLQITNLQLTNAGVYTVVVSDAVSTTLTSLPATLTVNSAGVGIALYPGVTIDGVTNQTYGIQIKTDLSNPNSWAGVTNITLAVPMQIWYDSQAATQPQRYYRVVPGPISIP